MFHQDKNTSPLPRDAPLPLKIRSILENNYENIEVRMSRTSDITKSLSQRTDEVNAWGADFYMSIHINSFNGSARGYEDLFTAAYLIIRQLRDTAILSILK